MAYDSGRGHTILFGGYDGSLRSDLWRWDGASWQLIPPAGAAPSARDAFAMAYDDARDRYVVFGGVISDVPGKSSARDLRIQPHDKSVDEPYSTGRPVPPRPT